VPFDQFVPAFRHQSLECPWTPPNLSLTRPKSSQETETGKKGKKGKKKPTPRTIEWDDFEINAEASSQPEDPVIASDQEPEAFGIPDEYSNAIQEEPEPLEEHEKCAQILVSSKHLSLASSYFRRNLGSGLLESHTLTTNGYVELRITDQDPQAMLIVMNIIHGRTRLVPRKVDLDTLTVFAILVDYLDCLEVVEPFSDPWINQLKSSIPSTYSKKLIQWLCISLIFKKES
jgi:hypothetical protein